MWVWARGFRRAGVGAGRGAEVLVQARQGGHGGCAGAKGARQLHQVHGGVVLEELGHRLGVPSVDPHARAQAVRPAVGAGAQHFSANRESERARERGGGGWVGGEGGMYRAARRNNQSFGTGTLQSRVPVVTRMCHQRGTADLRRPRRASQQSNGAAWEPATHCTYALPHRDKTLFNKAPRSPRKQRGQLWVPSKNQE